MDRLKRPRVEGGSRRSSLSMYAQAPDMELSMSQLEECCYMRLRLLRCIDHAKAKGTRGDELAKVIEQAERETLRSDGQWSEHSLQLDQCSHFLLRLAFCRTEDLRRYFLSNEHELFKFRFSGQMGGVARFLRDNEMKYEPIPESELETVQNHLQNVRRSVKVGMDASASVKEDHYKVPFEEVLDLVKSRRVYLRLGHAYVPHSELISIIGGQFRARLSKALVDASRAWPKVHEEEADRLSQFLEHCSTQYAADDYAVHKEGGAAEVSLAQLPMLSKRSFPLCMEHLNGKLLENSHLKHTGRMQLGLFFKGIGLSYDDSYAYWRSIFLKSMAGDKFDKEHRYSIRHNYGLEGAKKQYQPWGCAKVLGSMPAAGEHHGCPFRALNGEPLRAMLSRLSIKPADVLRIADKAANHHYQVACGLYFEARHAGSSLTETEMGGISHPNQYFDLSLKFYQEIHAAEATAKAAVSQPQDLTQSQENDDVSPAALPMAVSS